MKALIVNILTVLVLVSCTLRSSSTKIYDDFDTLCDADPDSAVRYLDNPRKNAIIDEVGEWFYRLMWLKANTKKDPRYTISTDTINQLIDYFEGLGDRRVLSEAYYYSASSLENMGDVPRALTYYQKCNETLPEKGMEKMKARCLYQIAGMKIYQYIYDSSLKDLQEAYAYCKKTNDITWQCFILNDIAWCQTELGKEQEAVKTYKKGLAIARENHDEKAESRLYLQYASCLIKLKRYKEAEDALNFTSTYMSSHNYDWGEQALLTSYSRIYKNTGRMSQAIQCYERLARIGSHAGKRLAYYELSKYYLEKGQYKEGVPFLTSFYEQSDSLDDQNASEVVANMNALYNYQLREKENLQLKEENFHKSLLVWGMSAVCIIIALTTLTLWFALQKNKQELRTRNNLLKQTLNENEELTKKADEQSKEMELMRQRNLLERMERDLALEKVKKTDIYKAFAENASGKGFAEQDPSWDELESKVMEAFPKMADALTLMKKMSAQQKHVTLLIKLEFSPSEISTLTQKSPSAISSTRERLFRSNFGSPKGKATDWDTFILAL